MSRARYKWIVVHSDDSVQIVEAETIDEVAFECTDDQPKAVIRSEWV